MAVLRKKFSIFWDGEVVEIAFSWHYRRDKTHNGTAYTPIQLNHRKKKARTSRKINTDTRKFKMAPDVEILL